MPDVPDAMLSPPDAIVASAMWQPEQLPTTADSSETRVQLVIDAAGTVTAAWRMDDGIVASQRARGGTWSAPAKIFPNDAHSDLMDLGADAAGNVIALFATVNTSPVSLWTARYTVGVGWGAPALLEIDDGAHHTVGRARLAITDVGDAIAIWDQFDGTTTNVWTRRWSAGAWQAAVAVGTGDAPAIGMSSSGHAVATWTDQGHQYVATIAPGEAWSAPVVLADSAGYRARIAVHENGEAVVIWEWLPPFEGGPQASYAHHVDGAWIGPYPLGRDAFEVDLAIDGAGREVAVWSQLDGLFWRRLDPEASRQDIGDTITIDDHGVPTGSVAMNDAADLIVVWVTSDNRVLVAQTREGPSGVAVDLDPGTAGESSSPEVVFAPDGAAVAAWTRSKGFDPPGALDTRYVIVSRAYE